MPLYDIRCSHCEGIFERLIPLQGLHGQTLCPYCKQQTAASPMPTGGHVGLQVKYRWQPRNGAEQLAGQGATGPGTHAGAGRSSVLHNCKGHSCSICAT
ncbi:putative FmdB family regulatory protein [Herbaspirillum rubrisubalbicans]|uniref:Zinc ribbon domain-containing protein n=1 Tax=Herbaspirillum rubrisubalbicans Os34 TaxID=1235827 RepID=A0A6M3ZST5_9BURK|nr:zinc ribbon domain-containing protein [Herbaspirillum rubrisubalbicans]MCP1573035.1 putative FmdB family regulatory protein [Herbaspirillum rubrisubalbicans]QJQ01586.1 zinc ribbon domain-containing protein [Herbaspirillum rubrisubalbicans Os34]